MLVDYYDVVSILGFDPKITQTLTEACTDHASPKGYKMKMKKTCLSAIFLT